MLGHLTPSNLCASGGQGLCLAQSQGLEILVNPKQASQGLSEHRLPLQV